MKMRKTVVALVGLLMATLIVAGCATKIKLQVPRTPTLNTTGIQRLTIVPFENVSGHSAGAAAATHATNVARDKITGTGHFTMVAAEGSPDAKFTGQITGISEEVTQREARRNTGTKDAPVWVNYTVYTRTVRVSFNYSIIKTQGGEILGPITKSGRNSDSDEVQGNLKSTAALIPSIIDWEMTLLARDVAPWTATVSRKMEDDKANKDAMKAANALVKEQNYNGAREAYLKIWTDNKSISAAINASYLIEASGNTQDAADFMQSVVDATGGSPRAKAALAVFQKELAEQAGVAEHDDTRTPAQKVAAFAVEEITKSPGYPEEPRLWIQNNATQDQALINNIIDDMTSAFIKSGVTVVERAQMDAILKEQNFQMGGNVTDDDLVRLGNMAGANAVIMISATGTGHERRLQARMLDLTTARILMQSDTSSDWNF